MRLRNQVGLMGRLLSGFPMLKACLIKRRVKRVKILFIQCVGKQSQVFAESLVMHHLARSQKADGILHVVVVTEAENIVVRGSGFLF